MRLNTKNLKNMLGHLTKCKPNNLLEITNYYELYFNKDGLTITATDGNNYINVYSEEGAQDDEAKIIVKSDQFTKLVSKITTDHIDLQVKADHLQVKGNGTYKCEMYADEDYPEFEIEPDNSFKINLNQLKHGIEAGKKTKSNIPADGVLFSYLIRNNKLIAADSIKVSYTPIDDINLETLIPTSFANLISALDGDVAIVSVDKNMHNMLIEGNNVSIYGTLADGVEEYPDVSFMFEEGYPHQCKLDKVSTLQAIDRLKLFLGAYDAGLLDMIFTDSALILSTLSGSNEIIPYINKVDTMVDTLEYRINGQYLNDILSSMLTDSFELHFGEDDSMKFVSNDDQFILATTDGDDE